MFNNFLNDIHDRRYHHFISKDGCHFADLERGALFYVFAGNDGLTDQIEKLYDFKKRCILPDVKEVDELPLSSGEKALVRLAYNLFNGYTDMRCDLDSIMFSLDCNNRKLAIQAIEQRFEIVPRRKPQVKVLGSFL